VIKAPEVMPEVLNDLEEDYTPDDEAFASMAQNQKSLRSTIAKVWHLAFATSIIYHH
jgi:ubiquitin-like domain-containing CTD phosphatase 1